MMLRNLRISIVSLGLAVAFFAAPSESKAFFGLFDHCCKGGLFAPTATYGADPCGCQPQRVTYMPQTCYRTQYVNVPTTVYRPVTVADPCTGCPVTTMRPMIAYLPQARQVPYVSYRIVYTNPPVVAYSGACAVGCAAPAYAAPTGCSGCGSATPTYASASIARPAAGSTAPPAAGYTAQPAAGYTAPPAAQPYYPGAISSPSTSRPASSYPAAGSSALEATFKDGSGTATGTSQESQKPIPDPETDKASHRGPASAPQLIGPDDSRTTYRPVRRAVHVEDDDDRSFTPASRVQPSARPAGGKANVWRQSNR